jgi:Carbohydrate family 9 binding domain-like
VTLQFLWDSQTGAKQETRARVVWDTQAFYVGFDADDAGINALFEQRDDPTYQHDAVEIFINPDPKQEALYYGFEMNARGVLYDYLNYNSRTLFKRWDGIAFPFGPFSNFDTRLPNSRNRQWLSPM